MYSHGSGVLYVLGAPNGPFLPGERGVNPDV